VIQGNTIVLGTGQVNELGSFEVLENTGAGWGNPTVTRIVPREPRLHINSELGSWVDISADERTIVLGAPATSLPINVRRAWENGLALVFEKGVDWSDATETTLEPPSVKPAERFGESVHIQGNLIAVGSSGALGEGAVYLYRKGTSWADATVDLLMKDIKPTTPVGRMDGFGRSTDLFAGWLLVGAPMDRRVVDSGGAVYLYDISSMIP
jgi:hypothetical protein